MTREQRRLLQRALARRGPKSSNATGAGRALAAAAIAAQRQRTAKNPEPVAR